MPASRRREDDARGPEVTRHPEPCVTDVSVRDSLPGRVGPEPADLVFPAEFQSYKAVRRLWDATCKQAKIAGATPHDARHTFAVHAMMAGVPLPRLQTLLGHSTPIMSLRYMRHAPEAFLDEDAAAVASHLSGATDQETAARAAAARAELKVV